MALHRTIMSKTGETAMLARMSRNVLTGRQPTCRAALKSRISPLRPIFWHLNRALLPWPATSAAWWLRAVTENPPDSANNC